MPKKDTYSANLAARLKASRVTGQRSAKPGIRATGKAVAQTTGTAQRKRRFEDDVASTPVDPNSSHPRRYPVHADPEKGQTYHGECNRTACESRRAIFWNRGTFGLYCPTCARGINANDPVPLCIVVEAKPTLEEMEVHYREMMDGMADLRRRQAAA